MVVPYPSGYGIKAEHSFFKNSGNLKAENIFEDKKGVASSAYFFI